MRTLVVASGKGGTGKTTVAAALIRIAARDLLLSIADCDVEASNLPLALRAEVTSRTPFAGRPRTVVDTRACVGCGECIDRCSNTGKGLRQAIYHLRRITRQEVIAGSLTCLLVVVGL